MKKRTLCAILLATLMPGALFPRAVIGYTNIRAIGPGFQYATPQKQSAAELQYSHGAYSVGSAHYRIAAGYEFAREAAYIRGGIGVGILYAMLNAELAQALKSDSFGTVFVPTLTVLIPCGEFNERKTSFFCEPYIGGWFAFKSTEESRFLFGLRILYGS